MGAEGALTLAVLIGGAAAGLTLVARALAPLGWLAVRPLSCDLCCSAWSALGLLILHELPFYTLPFRYVTLSGFGAVAVSVFALKTVGWLRDQAIPEEPPELPPL